MLHIFGELGDRQVLTTSLRILLLALFAIGLTILLGRLPPGGPRAADFANTLVLVALLGFLLVYAVRNTILMHPRLIGATQMNASLVHASMVAGLLLMLRTLLADLCALVPRRRGA